MITRNSSKAIAEAYNSHFTYTHTSLDAHGRRHSSTYNNIEKLYDFLYVNELEPWMLQAAKRLSKFNERGIIELIMQLHTGESSVNATPNWTWEARQSLGQRILKELAECLLRQRLIDPNFESHDGRDKDAVDLMRKSLELDGYIYRDGILGIPEETVFDEKEEEGVIDSLMKSLNLSDIETINHHLKLSETDYQLSHWDDSISNSRKVLEGILAQTAIRFMGITKENGLSGKELERAAAVRDYLERCGILEKKEKDTITSVYGLLSDTGGHPNIARQDQARLMRHLALTLSQFVLLKLEGAIHSRSDKALT
jgi:hypothetical protein